MTGGEEARSLEFTPTWAVAVACTVFVVASLIAERSLHRLLHWLSRTKRKPLYEAVDKMKEELMLLGFISLLIIVTQDYVARICISSRLYDRHFKPCSLKESTKDKPTEHYLVNRRRISDHSMQQSFSDLHRRQLVSSVGHDCKEGQEPFMSLLGLEQLHRLLFVLALTHIIYSCFSMLLAIIKVYSWRKWEAEAHTHADNLQNLADLTRTLTMRRQSTFVSYHTSTPGSKNKIILWAICFFRQFGQSVTKSDYLALRYGFVTKHSLGPKYDFHSYMIRSMEDEFKEVVGLHPLLWVYVVLFVLLNVHGSNLHFWISIVPIVLILLLGAKLQSVIATLALENAGLSGPLTGLNLRPRDSLFWFSRPRLLLHLIHLIIFQVAFELSTFLWTWWQFGWDSCLLERKEYLYSCIISGFLVQVLCSYSTLPLYAIVTQMGSNYKKAIFNGEVVESLHRWRKAARRHRHHREQNQQQQQGNDDSDDDNGDGDGDGNGNDAEIRLEQYVPHANYVRKHTSQTV